ncbi:hypothetical protein HBH56_214240 [Parastagonospora nodorum]|uniref:Fumarylacetoacetase-like C-terminal domain-containing protein n=1 Tax=Phaeosphaeria nodorum (strain SN15 / ATCC MYA-4574 / FGSC 10173) TaxID=321614 RepID=A0A7U2F346_PHANO|nr:hypothetical protein HBH56_214240 [Parastagonospora nodorum]QRC97802.1 hypothetical protein JI435_151450 [Parastagonospora nodorum SN15]KAH3923129.1 hypothetical protein HBH54_215910 [Parastagonospora nodorum]KAH4128404.1 hypothetical protein HBH45_211340 [Parastagonospora nodorum]KAH4149207.1 hypothetical protein HBH44_200440 [Parastagonospora nodorum]
MASFSRLVRFTCEDGNSYFADLGPVGNETPIPGTHLEAFRSYENLQTKTDAKKVTIQKLLAPLPHDGVPIYCIGLNFRSHAKEASLTIPSNPPLWTKPAASLAHPNEEIPINDFCARSLPDYEGELVFVTSEECKDVTESQAKDYILGYTIGNDLTCRMFQLPGNMSGQFFFAKAFDHFAPIDPVLISPKLFESVKRNGLTLKVNGEVRQKADLHNDMIFSPERILSHMSQGTTIPAGTAVMTGTCEGVGAFRKPKVFLQQGDVVEVSMPLAGTLRNTIKLE